MSNSIRNLNVEKVIENFEFEMFREDRDFEIANALEFPLFDKDEDNGYMLQFNREEKTYSIAMARFEENGGDYIDTEYIETYPMDVYNRYFLISRILKLMETIILPLNQVK